MNTIRRQTTIRRLACFLLIPILCLGGSISAKRDETAAYSWYVRRAKDHAQPQCDPSMQFIGDCNAFYIDRKAAEDGEKVLYLTFDAGYENGNIAKILDTLRAESVPAAFFILKNLIEREPDLVRRMADEGHLLCNHTMRHRDMTRFTAQADFTGELDGLKSLCRDTLGLEMADYYRPPEGRFSEQNLKYAAEAGYCTVFWSFAYADWDNEKQPSAEDARQKLLANTHNGAVILLHPTSATNAAILGDMIREWKAQGYRFGTLDELTERNRPADAENETE